ncbi:MAG: M2 family metallopeptidase [Paucibacter sp.]|nr:M2 family metallopeptidase [Roseateles sp.]
MANKREIVGFPDLANADLLIDATYQGGRAGNSGDDPLNPLLKVSLMGGFRYRGSLDALKLVVLTTTMSDPDWPDEIDRETGIFTYYGDNKKPGRALHETPRNGNKILKQLFDMAHGTAPCLPLTRSVSTVNCVMAGAGWRRGTTTMASLTMVESAPEAPLTMTSRCRVAPSGVLQRWASRSLWSWRRRARWKSSCPRCTGLNGRYQRAYKGQPFMFRGGADDGFHEAIGDSIALAVTPDYLKEIGLIDTVPPAEADIPLQLRTALDKIAFLPFALLIDKWRWQVFSGQIKPADYNKAWWALREQYQGVAPPVARSEADFDPGAKYHIAGNVPYARYFLAAIYQFQFYKAMCAASGYQGALNRCTFYGSRAAGDKLKTMLEAGQSQPAQATLKEMTGTDHLDAEPMQEYFRPLYVWLKQQNEINHAQTGWKSE